MFMINCETWLELNAHYQALYRIPLKQLFLENPNRFQQFSLEVADIFVDYSKNIVIQETIDLLCAFAQQRKLPEAINALFSGEKLNYSENRSALHTVLRLPAHKKFILDGIDLLSDVQNQFQKMARIALQLEKKELKGYSGKPIDTILHVGMGGSGLGPALYYQSVDRAEKNATCHFFTEFDYVAIQAKLALCNPETTIAVIVSKSFTTQDTLIISNTIKSWFCNAAGNEAKIQSHFYAVTAVCERAKALHFLDEHILKIADWVGGRYSIWSAVSFSVILSLGVKNFQRFLHGAHQIDLNFQHEPFKKNMPVIMALLDVWYNNFFHTQTRAIVPYSSRLSALPSYLQQLHMESLGKSVTAKGEKINYATGCVIWGDVGPSSQHSFHQLLMQGSQMIPVDFILPLRDGELNDYDLKRAAYCLSQSQTLMQGFDAPTAMQTIQGNRPSTTLLMQELTPEALGALLALYEHKVFAKSILWGINAFDQWGVERGKQVAQALIGCMTENKKCDSVDSSTSGLLEKVSRSLLV
ncbi:MAG: glucose-6-phosphate isomerase [Gammaproteobacteria bacterium RIFCSPHIGHO2_12_FULL_38_11]|nr:MAG: glucose-6-phosphate isomerase [Gammaproteobacteria bacterium RIFCSPHIGHO2_12_FULL_38_11]